MMRRLLLEILAAALIALALRRYVAALARVKGRSMLPTLPDGAILYASVWRARLRLARRGDIVLCRYPGRGRQLFVKRLVGLPGDRVRREGGVTYVNGVALDNRCYKPDYPDYTLGRREYFVAGDNRGSSHDSRDWRRRGSRIVGPIDAPMIRGVVRLVLWPPKAAGRTKREYQPKLRGRAGAEKTNSETGDDRG